MDIDRKDTSDKFWARVTKAGPDECWEWTGSKNSGGYGVVRYDGVCAQAHRVSYFLTHDGIGLLTGFRIEGRATRFKNFVLHKCGNRLCCNPNHLFLGSMRTKEVQPRSRHVNAKLTPDQVREMRHLYDTKQMYQRPLAKKFNISQRVVSLVVRRETYKDIK
jgi:hypothetical protein